MKGKNNTPAVLFYSQDFLAGVADMTYEERGAYITLLAYQNVHGHMSRKYIERVCPGCPSYVLDKFIEDADGNLYNERMQMEIDRRNRFKKSREKNLKQNVSTDMGSDMGLDIGNRYGAPIWDTDMETETETETVTEINTKGRHKKVTDEEAEKALASIRARNKRKKLSTDLSTGGAK